MEARGEIRGGRFIAGVGGEQYAAPETVEILRHVRDEPADGGHLILSAADPLNLTGIVLPGPRLPAVAGNALVLGGGQVVAVRQAGEVRIAASVTAERTEELLKELQRTA
jgi:ATP-dependent Lhr-like helicase